jgi:hypothetical protein
MELVVVAQLAPAALIAFALELGCNGALGIVNTVPADGFPTVPNCTPGHDEDGDGIDDCIDNCPGIANPMQDDVLEIANGQPADHVGDACDPSPTKTGDVRTKFVSFADPNERLEWQVVAGSWVVVNDAYVYTGTNSANAEETDLLAPRPAMPFAFVLRVVLADVSDATTETFGISLDLQARAACEIFTGASSQLNVYESGSAQVSVPAGTFAPGLAFTIRGELRGGIVHCSIDGVVAGTFTNGPVTYSNQLALYAKTGTFRVTYLELYDLSGEP